MAESEVKTNALMPSGQTNGLDSIASELVAEAKGEIPSRLRAVIALVDAKRANVDKDSGAWTVTVRFRRVEVLLPSDLPEAEKLIRRALEKRSGQTVLSLELEQDLESAFEVDFTQPDPDEADHPVEAEIVDEAEDQADDPEDDMPDDPFEGDDQ